MAPMTYSCDLCSQSILSDSPRVHCLICTEYDLCANCTLGERFSKGHSLEHAMTVFKKSGGNGERPSVAERVSLNFGSIMTVSSPTTAVHPIPPHLPQRRTAGGQPPPLPPRQGSSSSRNSLHSAIGSPQSSQFSPHSPPPSPHPHSTHSYTMPTPPPQPRPSPVRGETTPRSFEQAASSWGPFFNTDMSPSTLFSELLDAMFSYLDPKNTGYLTPETYSKFLDDQGYMLHENAWKSALKPQPVLGIPQEYLADKTLKDAYDLFSIDHVTQERPKNTITPCGSNPFTTQFRKLGINYEPSPPPSAALISSNGIMPLLTRKGFLDITCVEVLHDPSKHWGNLNRVLKRYVNAPQAGPMSEYRRWGDLPRTVLPEMPDPAMVERVKRITEVSKRKAQEQTTAAYTMESLAAQGRQNGLDLIDNRYVYRYY
ncbi:hypothetical protein E1B28_004899 [Marasmius oreades]|uniref:ZZ-type domain-containing protein n=1 Tax=Marasmius oreades TaxID=181124 RepID=A0A9P7UZM7_9AGAR|nr:uncharacterized protein E1B28_004899 [Marasmius oreades]KAG7097562.1 hypothetical protein E1B28_004899 [Marasmius oreades]